MKCEACEHENVDGARFCAGCGALMRGETQEGADPLIGQIIGGRYRITGVLGEGGMGVVYVAEQQMGSTVRKVAVKTLHPHLSKDASVLARFHRECGTVAQLEHPNTIKFYDFGATPDGTLYIAMEFVRGTPLDRVIESSGSLPPDRMLKIMKQICGALDEAHKLGIIHRDLKPENIILTSRAGEADTVKVLDFGIAARSESSDAQREQKLTQQGMVLGTPPYMSPEQFTGKALDLRSDLYSLGVMAYEMLTGRLPFEADTPWQWATQHMTAQPLPFEATAPTGSLPSHLRKAILRALSKDRDERQNSANEFFSELSGGGGLTVDEVVPASFSSAGTAAMAAVPDFGGHPAQGGVPIPTAGMPATGMPAGVPFPMGVPVPAMPVGVPLPPAARSGSGVGGGAKLLIVLLLLVGAAIAVAFVIVLLQSMKPDEDSEVALTNPFASSGDQIEVAPLGTGPAEEDSGATSAVGTSTAAATATSVAPRGGGASGGAPASSPPSSGGTSSTGSGGSTSSSGGSTSSSGGSASTSPAPSGAACDACISAASGGNIQGAAAKYNQCNDSAKKTRCSQLAKGPAVAAARAAALNGNCAQARAIVAAARSMGAGTGALDNAIASCR